MSDQPWRKPSRCEAGHCVEFRIYPNVAYIRHSQQPDRVLAFTADEWAALIADAKEGKLDLMRRHSALEVTR